MSSGSFTSFRVVLAILAAGWLTGCVAVGIVDTSAGTIDHSVGRARNNSILLNIVRASRYEPLYFYSVSRVSGGGTADLKLSLPALTFGPHQTSAQRDFTLGYNGLSVLDSQQTGSFDVAILESKDFYEGMLQPLSLTEIGIILHEGFSRELIYRLAVETVTVYDAQGLHRYVNDPASDTYGGFELFFDAALSHGVTVESFETPAPSPRAGEGGLQASDDRPRTITTSRLCFDPALVTNPADLQDAAATGNECGERPPPAAGATQSSQDDLRATYLACAAEASQPRAKSGQTLSVATQNRVCAHLGGRIFAVELSTRSLFGIYSYLGGLLRQNRVVQLGGLGADVEPRTTGPLLVVNLDNRGPCFAKAALEKTYCIPEDGAENLKEVFSLLNALQAVKTSPGDLPITPAVRIEQ